jgi:hypothetical protein
LLFGLGLLSFDLIVSAAAGTICLPRMRRDMMVCTAPDRAYLLTYHASAAAAAMS